MASAPVLGGGTVDAGPGRVRGALQHAARARDRARGAQRAPARHRVDQDARRGLRRRRQAVAPEGHRPRSRRLLALAGVGRRRHRVRPQPAALHRQGQPQGAPRGAARRAVAARRARVAGRVRRGGVRGASTAQAADLLADWGATAPTLVLLTEAEAAAGKSFRNLSCVGVMPVDDAGVADIVGAASLLVSQAALERWSRAPRGRCTCGTATPIREIGWRRTPVRHEEEDG